MIQDKIEGLFDFYIILDHRVVSLVERDEDKFGVHCCSLLLEMKTRQIWRKCFFVVVVPKVRDMGKVFLCFPVSMS